MKKDTDALLKLLASPGIDHVRRRKAAAAAPHKERAHSKFSASGAERWFQCPGSVELSEGLPDQTSVWAQEGTEAHEVLEKVLVGGIESGTLYYEGAIKNVEMFCHAVDTAKFILKLHESNPDSDILVETRIHLDFIHPEMFGTFDGAVVDHFGTLHVFDYKYGAGKMVSPVENLQMIFYGIGLAHQFKWNFEKVRLWIIQPRVKGYDGPSFWEISIQELRAYVDQFRRAVKRVELQPDTFVEGPWCWWCKAKSVCPLKRKAKEEEARSVFTIKPILSNSKIEETFREESRKGFRMLTEADWRKKSRTPTGRKKRTIF